MRLLSENGENYLKFLNEILFAKKRKQGVLAHMSREYSSVEKQRRDRRSDEKEIENLNTRFHHELGVRGDLQREAEECWKSIVHVE